MKLFSLLIICIVTSCTTNKVTVIKQMPDEAVQKEAVEPNEKQFMIKTVIYKNDEIWVSPHVVVNEGKEANIRIVKEQFLPQKWTSPKVSKKEGREIYQPASPVFDDPTFFGFTLKVFAERAETFNSNDWIHIQGNFTNRESGATKKFDKDKIEVLNNYVDSYTTDTGLYSLFVKDNSYKQWDFKSGNNDYKIKFFVKEVGSR